MINYSCGCKKDYCPGQVINTLKKCYGCMSKLFGQRVEFVRYGDLPAGGRSINYADNKYEAGVSCYLVEQGEVVGVVRSEFADRESIRGTAIAIDTGSDDELIIDPKTIILTTQAAEMWRIPEAAAHPVN